MNDTAQRVKRANRELYDLVADRYEDVDGRRSPELEAWLRGTLSALAERTGGKRLLDLGTGSGLVPRCATGLYDLRFGIDLSPRILALNRPAFDGAAAADVDRLPFPDGSFDVVTGFAVLHHLPSFEGLAGELARVLSRGGVFYSDHDMDDGFFRRFRWPLAVYRRIHDARSAYEQASPEITGELYDDAEWSGTVSIRWPTASSVIGISGAAGRRCCRSWPPRCRRICRRRSKKVLNVSRSRE